jgi:excinuclease ABC subunit C
MQFQTKKLSSFPIHPGVYLMKGSDGTILYIGKAKNLKARVRQYFFSNGDGRWIIPFLQERVVEIDTVVTTTEKEALLLECNLIKQHQPQYNALLKDDKTYTALKVNIRHAWPMLSLIRYKGKLKNDAAYFGPYTSAYDARQTLDLLQRIFPLRQCSDQELKRRTRPCILYDMKRCCAPCVGLVTKERYNGYVDDTLKFLKGQSKDVLEMLKKGIEEASEKLEFEHAEQLHLLLKSVERTLQLQSVDKPISGVTGDVLGVFRKGDEVVLSQLTFSHGRLNSYQHHNFSKILESDAELLETFILQQYIDRTQLPKQILVGEDLEDRQSIEEILGGKVAIMRPERGEKRTLIEMAVKNAEAAFHQKKDKHAIVEKALLQMQDKFQLKTYPERIECVDTSHLSGDEAVSAIVSYINGEPDKDRYRRYKLRITNKADDYGALREVLQRRYAKDDMPDLLIIDGGKGHLNAALKILKDMNIVTLSVIGVAKEEGRHDKGSTNEQIFLENLKDPVHLPPYSPALYLLQRIRDEAHRFAITYQKKRRTLTTIRSELASVPGIGPVKQKALLKHFGSVRRIKEATDEELQQVAGISKANIMAIREIIS